MEPIRVLEMFAGIGSQVTALKRAGVPLAETYIAEIDPKAIRMYEAMHGPVPNLGDVTKIEHLPDVDLVTWSFPCQDLSVTGRGAGMVEGSGTRSALGWEVIRLVKDAVARGKAPRYLLMENVPAILFKKNMPEFTRMCKALEECGYRNDYAVLNALDYGVPQKRRRCFMVSEYRGEGFVFPEGKPFEGCLMDVLEKEVDEEYYLSPERIAKFEAHRVRQEENGRNFGRSPISPEGVCNAVTTNPDRHASGNFLILAGNIRDWNYDKAGRVYSPEGCCPTIETPSGGGKMPKIVETVKWPNGSNKAGYSEAKVGDGVKIYPDPSRYNSGGTVQDQKAGTLNTYRGCGVGTVTEDLRIRYITPREAWRLMGFDDVLIDRAFAVEPAKTARYKAAGNSIVVNVLEAIFRTMYAENRRRPGQRCLDDYGGKE